MTRPPTLSEASESVVGCAATVLGSVAERSRSVDYMARAVELGYEAIGASSPNPSVGAVVVRRRRVVGEGFTQPPGGPHAEIVALRQAGDRARGATLWCTLEPCSHFGRTPPCADAIIAAGVREVRYALGDPDGNVDGDGRTRLAEAGVRVVVGEGEAEARALHEGYLHQRRTGRPLVIAKFAASLDGKIAATSGDSRWVSGPQTLDWAHRIRARLDAIIVGVNTVLVDNPRLTARPPGRASGSRQPLRIVVDSHGRTPAGADVLSNDAPTLLATTGSSPPAWRASMAGRGAEVVVLPESGGRVDLHSLIELLAARGALQVLVEGGGTLLGSFFDLRLVDKVTAVIAPIIIGGATAATAVGGRGAARMAETLRLRDVEVSRLGDDTLITGYLPKGEE